MTWLKRDEGHGSPDANPHQAPWYVTLWLTGVDYFSSLGYAPGLAIMAAGYVAPIATLFLIAVTFLAAVPVYALVARHSYQGEGSIKMNERLTTGWGRLGWLGKTLVLILLGFAMTDFVITISLSAADASLHIIQNPWWPKDAAIGPMLLTSVLILALGAVFLRGFKEAIGIAMLIAVPYMVLNYVVIGVGFAKLAADPRPLSLWWQQISNFDVVHLRTALAPLDSGHGVDPLHWLTGQGWSALFLASLLVFPKLALGLSGFETGVAVMPLVAGKTVEERVANTRRLLVTAAALMSVGLLGSSIVTTTFVPLSELGANGAAHGRAISFLAHNFLGHGFGTAYDLATVAILWFAGASAMAGLLNLIPRYLPRFGMSPDWLTFRRPLVLVLTGICMAVNISFEADVEAQGGAYATGVLVLMASGAFAVLLAEWKKLRLRLMFFVILLVFLYVLVVNVAERPDGIRIAGYFIGGIVLAGLFSRWRRASELRVKAFSFTDPESEILWKELVEMPHVVLIPLRTKGADARNSAVARNLLHLEVEKRTVPVFLHVELSEDPSEFASPIRVQVSKEGKDYVVQVNGAVAVANAIAYVALGLEADEIVIGLLDSGTRLVNASMYLIFGTGEVGYAVRTIFMRLKEGRTLGLDGAPAKNLPRLILVA